MPILVITGQKPITKSKQGQFQIIDAVSMMKPVTKSSTTLIDPTKVPSLIAHLLQDAEAEKPGAVHLELPEDIAGMHLPDLQLIPLEKVRRPIPDEKAIKQLKQMIEIAQTPLLLVGAGANRKRVTKRLTHLITTYNIPFFTSQMGTGVVDERLPQYIGTAALTAHDHLHATIAEADLIIAIGHDIAEKPTHLIERGKTNVIHIHFIPAQFDALYEPVLQVVGDIGNTLRQLAETGLDPTQRDHTMLYAKALEARQQLLNHARSHYKQDIMMPARLIDELRLLLHDDDIITLDNGLYKVWFARNYPCHMPNTLLLDNALATMGA